ncbi:MAG TPA: TIGR02117 family protein [Caldithrix abyssi]|uniref:TIGR02117 family protein n=1 Tax=Caldithrix abyssi TaxID=187145 RepID=A0A7V1LPP5_CALAY|nr:TIGR02117 family protein [Caldithrix abyssi]
MKVLIYRIIGHGLRLAQALVLLLLLYLLAAVIFTLIPVNKNFTPAGEGMEIFIYSSMVHTDIILPLHAPGLREMGIFTRQMADEAYTYAGFGWGDRDFYLYTPAWEDVNLFVALRSLFWPTTSVMHVTMIKGRLEESKSLKSIRINSRQYDRLLNFISRSFRRDDDGRPRPLAGKGYTDRDRFFEANGHYSLFYTCNNWTIEALTEAGIKMPLWSPFAQSVSYHLK